MAHGAENRPKPSRGAVVVTLRVQPDSALFFRSVELINAASRIRFSFPAETRPAAILEADAWAEIYALLQSALEQRGMLAMPDHVIRLADLALGDANVISTATSDGGEQIMIRFSQYYGEVLSLFAEGSGPRESLSSGVAEHSAAALEEAFLPLYDFAAHVDALRNSGVLDASGELSAALLSVVERIRALQVHRVVAKRMVDEQYSSSDLPRLIGDGPRTAIA